jgi:hypothetical protein
LADFDLLFGQLRRQRVGPQAVDADLVVIVAERQQRRGAIDEPVAAGAGPIGRAVRLADGFQRRHHGPTDIGYRIDRIAFVSCLSDTRSARCCRRDKGRSHENDGRWLGHALPRIHAVGARDLVSNHS